MTDNVFAPPRANVDVRSGPDVLWDMTFKELRKLYLASSNIQALGVLWGLGAVLLAFMAWSFMNPGPRYRSGIFSLWPIYAVLVIPSAIAAVTSFTRPSWARWLGIALCLLNLINIPLGTLIAIMGLIAYAQGARLFGPDRIAHRELAQVYKLRKKDKK